MPFDSNDGFPHIERGQAYDSSAQDKKPSHAASSWDELQDTDEQDDTPVFASAGSSSVIPVQPVIPGPRSYGRSSSVAEALHERLARVRNSVERRIPSVDAADSVPAKSVRVEAASLAPEPADEPEPQPEPAVSEPAHQFVADTAPEPEPLPEIDPDTETTAVSEPVPEFEPLHDAEPEPAHASAYAPDPAHVPDPSYTPEPAYVPEPSYPPEPAYTPEPSYPPEPSAEDSTGPRHGSHFSTWTADPEQPEPIAETQAIAPSEPAHASHLSDDDTQARIAFQRLEERRAKERKKRFIRIGIVAGVVLLGVLIWAIFFNKPPVDETMQTASVEEAYTMDFVSTVKATGTLKPNESVVVTPEVDGIIESLNVTQDQFVNEGDILLTIKNDELDQAVRSAEQQISQARNEITQANAALNAANASYRAKEQAASIPIPDPTDPTDPTKVTYPEFDEASAAAEITAAKGQVSAAELALENAQTAYDNAVAQANKRTVYAPTSGTVVALTAQVGAPVGGSGKAGLMQIADVSKMRVTVQVNEVDISTILVGQKADVTFNAVPDATLEADVVNIASVATGMEGDASAGGSSSVANFAVDLLISTPDLRLKPGMTANVAIRTIEVPGAIVAPAAAVTDNGDGTGSVQRVINEETKETETVSVRLGSKGSGVVVITEGLSAGDKLLVQGSASTDATTEAAVA